VQTRDVGTCRGAFDEEVPLSLCGELEAPDLAQACVETAGCQCEDWQLRIDACAEENAPPSDVWQVRPWRGCSAECGLGQQERHVFCTGSCPDEDKPVAVRSCERPCEICEDSGRCGNPDCSDSYVAEVLCPQACQCQR
jgi:hypothetical protein